MNIAYALLAPVTKVNLAIVTLCNTCCAEVHSHLVCMVLIDFALLLPFWQRITTFHVSFTVPFLALKTWICDTWQCDTFQLGNFLKVKLFFMDAFPTEPSASETYKISAVAAHQMTHSAKTLPAKVVYKCLCHQMLFLPYFSVQIL